MSFDPASVFVGLLASAVGFVLTSYGKKQSRPPQLIAGVLLLVLPFCFASAWVTLGACCLVVVALFFALSRGY